MPPIIAGCICKSKLVWVIVLVDKHGLLPPSTGLKARLENKGYFVNELSLDFNLEGTWKEKIPPEYTCFC